MSEFSLIEKYCTNLGVNHANTKLSVGDDAAVIHIPADMDCAVSVDTMVEGVHFLPDVSPAKLAAKLLAVNLSDMAAMGAVPKWATLALTLPADDSQWLSDFSQGLDAMARQHQVELVGGDTTQGPLTLSLQIMGLLPKDQRLTRHNARVGDDIYVSNSLGDAALGLALLRGEISADAPKAEVDFVIDALQNPIPQCDLGARLLGLASACIDVSDGLIGDLSHIAERSGVQLIVDVQKIPLSQAFLAVSKAAGTNAVSIKLALTGGDDYQLAFTAAPMHRQKIAELAQELNVSCTIIGEVLERDTRRGFVELLNAGRPFKLDNSSSYCHFS